MGKVISFKRDINFFLKLIDENITGKNFIQAIKFINNAFDMGFYHPDIYYRLGICYRNLDLFVASNTAFFMALLNDKQKVFFEIGENFFIAGDKDLARIYFNRCLLEGKNELYERKVEKILQGKTKKAVKVYKFEKNEKIIKLIKPSKNDEKTAQKFKYQNIEDVENNREAYSLFLNKQYDEAFSKITNNGKKEKFNFYEICNLVLIYDRLGNESKKDYYLKMFNEYELVTLEEVFRKAIVLGALKKDNEACKYFEMFLEYSPYNSAVMLFYGINLINLNKKDLAKKVLLDGMAVTFFKSIFKYYLSFCEKKYEVRLDYLNEVPQGEIRSRIKRLEKIIAFEESITDADLLDDYFYESLEWVFFSNFSSKNLLFFAAAGANSPKINHLINYFLCSDFIDMQTKIGIIKAIILSKKTKEIGTTINNIYYSFKMPESKLLESELLVGYAQAQIYLLKKQAFEELTLIKEFNYLAKLTFSYTELKETSMFAAMLVYLFTKNKFSLSLSTICKSFNIDEDEFIALAKKLNI